MTARLLLRKATNDKTTLFVILHNLLHKLYVCDSMIILLFLKVYEYVDCNLREEPLLIAVLYVAN